MLGRAFVEKWSSNCVAMVRSKARLPCAVVEGFLDEPNSILAVIRKVKPAVCFHFAACTSLSFCERNPDYAGQVNATASAAIAKACADVGARVVYMCTDSIFDGRKRNYAEADTPAPLNVYAQSKLRGELALLASGGRNISIRGNIFGTEREQPASLKLYDWILKNLITQEPIIGFADVFFNPLSVDTLSEVLVKMLQLDVPGGCWHVGTTNPISKDQFIRLIAKINRLSDACATRGMQQDLNLHPVRPLNTTLQTLKIESAGIPMPTIESELEFFRK